MNIPFKDINILKRNLKRIIFIRIQYFKPGNNMEKRGKMLDKYVQNKDKKKHWHFNIMSKPQNSHNIFDKVHKPSRRVSVLNALFIRNITDVLSTSDIAPEVLKYGIEITDIKITSDFRIVNVYYALPLSKLDSSEEIHSILSLRGPQLRAELISRNILGKVPKLYFVRDKTNSKLAEFEKTLQLMDCGPEDKEKIVPDEDFLNDKIFKFTTARDKIKAIKSESMPSEDKEICVKKNPINMKSNVLGLNHDALMTRLYNSKKQSVSISKETETLKEEANDLFNQIPGTPLQHAHDRKELLKKFCLDRKVMLKQKTKIKEMEEDAPYSVEIEYSVSDSNYEPDYYDDDDESTK